jgi:hypothetical protein
MRNNLIVKALVVLAIGLAIGTVLRMTGVKLF